jgi:hypothetical protein
MATKGKYLFLYLAVACFLGLIAIFVVDGYLGVYDTIMVTTGEREQKIEADFWMRKEAEAFPWEVHTNWGEGVSIRYELDNRQFSTYSTQVSISLWRSEQKLKDLASQTMQLAPFDKGELKGEINTEELIPGGVPQQGPSYQFSVIIERDGVKRRIIVGISPGIALKPPPIPTPIK